MSVKKPSAEFGQVVSITSLKHELSIDILIGFVKPGILRMPYGNYECTDLFLQTGRAALQDITPDGKAYFETFRRSKDFEDGFATRLNSNGHQMATKFQPDKHASISAPYPAPF